MIIALDRLQAARIYEAGLTGTLLPAVDASGAFGRGTGDDLTRGRAGEPLISSDDTHGLTNVKSIGGFDAVWQIDVFGKVRREMEQARYNTQAAADARNAVLVSVIADVAQSYVDLRELQMRASVLQSAASVLQRGLDIVNQRYQRGITNELDVMLAKRELATVEAQIPIIDAEVSSGEYAIATLLGEYPEDLVHELATPQMIPSRTDSDLARTAAWICCAAVRTLQEAEREIASANAGIGIATANLFPQLFATAAIGAQQGTLGAATIGEHIWSAGPGVVWPLLDFGQLDARVQIANVRTGAALENYKADIEQAVRQVDSSVVRFDAAQQSIKSLGDALVASQQAVTLATERYQRGLTDYLNVVDAESAEYSIEEAVRCDAGCRRRSVRPAVSRSRGRLAGIPEAAADPSTVASGGGDFQGYARPTEPAQRLLTMALKDVLVWLDQTNRSSAHLRLAADLARRHGSYLTALYAREWNPAQLARRKTAELAGRPLADVEELNHAAKAAIDASAAEARAEVEHVATQHGIEIEWRVADGEASRVLPQYARYADSASSMPRYRPRVPRRDIASPRRCCSSAGRPVLLVPHACGRYYARSACGNRLELESCFRARDQRCTAASRALRAHDGDRHQSRRLHGPARVAAVAAAARASAAPRHLGALRRTVQRAVCRDRRHLAAAGSHRGSGPAGRGGARPLWLRDMLLGSVTRDLLERLRLPVMMSN